MAPSELYQGSYSILFYKYILYLGRFEWQNLFHQLYTLSGEVLNHVFGSAYCLLQKKDKNIYCIIFSFIKHWAHEHGFIMTIVDENGSLKTDLGTYEYILVLNVIDFLHSILVQFREMSDHLLEIARSICCTKGNCVVCGEFIKTSLLLKIPVF